MVKSATECHSAAIVYLPFCPYSLTSETENVYYKEGSIHCINLQWFNCGLACELSKSSNIRWADFTTSEQSLALNENYAYSTNSPWTESADTT